MSDDYENDRAEYWYNVMRQVDMPLAGTIDHVFDCAGLKDVLSSVAHEPFPQDWQLYLLGEPTRREPIT